MMVRADIEHEVAITWLEDVEAYPWVRVWTATLPRRRGIAKSRVAELKRGGNILVGYADLSDDAPEPSEIPRGGRPYFLRRVFVVEKGDRLHGESGTFPAEAVATQTIRPGVEGIHPSQR
ncbi:DUF6009 family protein [Lyngbya sp. CCY1209]|uniref:DUF6009 family protein n=1 Tax=Lyngbya sp. CCY1209 TaxID=2886103 RepID=UPI002D1FFC83|nr:DUF6009 family protein [Lyngbya sp. CCY1209]MEB3884055.1 DUF6009 family protein [Lyngbya sp. CCY1209]